jgi:uncharacterized delta-60 repeat protein
MTLNATKYIMSASGGGESYWAAFLGGSSDDEFLDLAVDSNGDIVALGSTSSDGRGTKDFLIAKFDKNGDLLWDRTLGLSSALFRGRSVDIDSSDNIIISGYGPVSGNGEQWLLAKYNSSGVLQWDKHIGPSGSASADRSFGVAFDSSDDIIGVGWIQTAPSYQQEAVVAKFASSDGSITWQRKLDGTGNDNYNDVKVDSSDNVYAIGYSASSGGAGNNDFLIVKYNSSGTIQWKKVLGGTGTDVAWGIEVDSSANVYTIGYSSSSGVAGGFDYVLAKYDSSGTFQFDKALGGLSNDFGYGVTVDSSGNIYVVGASASAGPGSYSAVLAKYNSSGVVQWQNSFGGTGNSRYYRIKLDADENIYFCGWDSTVGDGGDEAALVKVRSDGSGTGTFGAFTYATSTLTANDITLTDQTAGANDAGISMVSNDATFTDAPAVLTSTKVNM